METLPLNEDNFPLDDIYNILSMVDESNEYRTEDLGRVIYYRFTVLSDCSIAFNDEGDMVEIKGGLYTLVLNAYTREWITMTREETI
jgi:hypothetical protein